jgi:hypothetical protein
VRPASGEPQARSWQAIRLVECPERVIERLKGVRVRVEGHSRPGRVEGLSELSEVADE